MFRADLHIHSNFSDGTNTPFEILHLAKEAGLGGLAITDHDTMAAYTEVLFQEAKKLDLDLLPGVEVSSSFNGDSVHILGYGKGLLTKPFFLFLEELRERKRKRNIEILKKLEKKGMKIAVEELYASSATIGRPHIACLLVEKGYVRSVQEAFDRYLEDGASCYVMGEKFSPVEVIEKIHEGGKAILAHPGQLKDSVVKKLFDFPFNGIEGHSGKKQEEKKWIKLAEEKGWLITGGSDFHGTLRPFLSIGRSWTDEKTFQAFK